MREKIWTRSSGGRFILGGGIGPSNIGSGEHPGEGIALSYDDGGVQNV